MAPAMAASVSDPTSPRPFRSTAHWRDPCDGVGPCRLPSSRPRTPSLACYRFRMAQPLPRPVDEHLTNPRPLVFPTEAEVPESKDHVLLRTALFLVLTETFADTAWIGSEQFVYYDASDPTRVVAPDVFVRRGGPDESFSSWKVWERGCPELAIEIVSNSDASPSAWEKKLARYHAMGVAELWRFQADAETPLRVWDRVDDNLLERRADGLRATSRVLGLELVVVGRALRLERDGVILPTPSERAAAESLRAVAAAERAAAETARADRLRAKLVAAGIDPDD
jgi:Uma2 family endonuclease